MTLPLSARTRIGVLAVAMALVLCGSAVPAMATADVTTSSPPASYPHSLAFIWYFGYLGDEFQPQTDDGITQGQMLNEAANISNALGGPHDIVFIHAIAESSQKYITPDMIPEEASYVSQLKHYAEYVSGWEDLKFVNVTSSENIYTEVAMMVNEIGVNAIWLDHAVGYYSCAVTNPTTIPKDHCNTKASIANFNEMMTRLHDMFPHVLFFLNVSQPHPYITPAKGSGWGPYTYVFPTFHETTNGTLFAPDLNQTRNYNDRFPGRVVMHFDSQASADDEPMGHFANLTAYQESSYVKAIFQEGLQPTTHDYGFNLLIPIVGANTCDCSSDQGRVFNGLSIDFFDKGSADLLINDMKAAGV